MSECKRAKTEHGNGNGDLAATDSSGATGVARCGSIARKTKETDVLVSQALPCVKLEKRDRRRLESSALGQLWRH